MSDFAQSFKTGFKYIRRSRFLTITCLFVMTVSFLVSLFFGFSFVAANSFLKALAAKAQITVFFKTATPAEAILAVSGELKASNLVEEVNYVSQEEALKLYLGQHQDNPALLELVSGNILPASLEIKTKELSSLESLATQLKENENVDEVVFFKDVVENFRRLNLVFQILGFGLAALMVFISLLVVLLSVGISVKIRADEIEIRRLAGATDLQVSAPFLWQGLIYGFVSTLASLAIFLLIVFFSYPYFLALYTGASLPGPSLGKGSLPYILVITFHLFFGPALGIVSSLLGVRKYLRL